METVHVDLGNRAYEVRIGGGLIARAGEEISDLLHRPRVAVITDQNVAALHLETLGRGLAKAGIEMTSLALPPGESTKGWPQFTRAVEWLLEATVSYTHLTLPTKRIV